MIDRKLLITNTSSNRNFGLIFSGIFALISIYFILLKDNFPTTLISISALFFVFAILIPKILGPLNRVWFIFGNKIGSIVSKIIMSLIYITTVVPIGLILKMFRKDLLKLKKNKDIKTYWIKKEKNNSSIENQF